MYRRTLFSAVLVVFLWAWADVLLWQRIFDAHQLWKHAHLYHAGMRVLWLCILISGGSGWWAVSWRHGALWIGVAHTLAHGGLTDLLYYAYDGMLPLEYLPWLTSPFVIWGWFEPMLTRAGLFLSVGFWGVFWVVMLRGLEHGHGELHQRRIAIDYRRLGALARRGERSHADHALSIEQIGGGQ